MSAVDLQGSGGILIFTEMNGRVQDLLMKPSAAFSASLIILFGSKINKMTKGIPCNKKKFFMETLNETGKLLTPSKDGSVILDLSGEVPLRVPNQVKLKAGQVR
jgi:hypothetical protein